MFHTLSVLVRSRLYAGLLLAVAAGLFVRMPAAAPVPVVVVTAELRELTPLVQVAGTVISRNDTRLAAQVEGQVSWVADVGTALQQGEVAAQLDDVLLRDVLVEEEASVQREQAEVAFYSAEVKRLTQLARSNNAAQSRLDQARRDLAVARSEQTAAESRLRQVREKLERTAVRAPFAGVVTERFIQAGEWADPGSGMIRLVDTGALEVQAWVPVSTLPYIRLNAKLNMQVTGQQLTGTVRAMVPVGDEKSRLYELRLSPGPGALSVGQGVRVALPTAEPQSVVVIPRDALVLRRDGTSVFRVLEDNTAERVPVATGMAQGDWIEVGGAAIRPGDRVVVRGGERLRTGQDVSVTPLVTAE